MNSRAGRVVSGEGSGGRAVFLGRSIRRLGDATQKVDAAIRDVLPFFPEEAAGRDGGICQPLRPLGTCGRPSG